MNLELLELVLYDVLQGVQRLVGKLDWQSGDPGIGAPSIGRERRLDGDTETVTGRVPVQLRQQNSKASKQEWQGPRGLGAAEEQLDERR